jgi:26S proteasome regulatory subunit N10
VDNSEWMRNGDYEPTQAEAESVGKQLKKNNVALNIVSFWKDDGEKADKLETLLNAVNNNDNSHIVHIPRGDHSMLSDVLITSGTLSDSEERGSGNHFAATPVNIDGGGGALDFGVDPEELALALRASMEEERAWQEAAGLVDITDESGDMMIGDDDDDDGLWEQASGTASDVSMAGSDGGDQAYAMEVSVQRGASAAQGDADVAEIHVDWSFLASALGVDPDDPCVQDVLDSLLADEEE